MENQDSKKRKKRDELLSDDESEIDSEVEEEQFKTGLIKKPRTTETLSGAMQTVSSIPVTSYMNPVFIGPPVEQITPESITPRAAPQLPSDAHSNQLPPLESQAHLPSTLIPTEIESKEIESNTSSLIQQAESPLECITLEDLNSNKMPIEGMLTLFVTYFCYLISNLSPFW